MWSLSTKMIIFCLTVMLIMTVAMASSNKNDGEAVESVETCSKDDQICQKAAKAKETTKSGETDSADKTGADKSKAKDSSESLERKDKTDVKPDEKKAPKKTTKKKTKTKSDSDVADCPLCSYTRPLVKRIMEWIRELLTDPMMIMVFEFAKEKVWELGKMTKQALGVRLF